MVRVRPLFFFKPPRSRLWRRSTKPLVPWLFGGPEQHCLRLVDDGWLVGWWVENRWFWNDKRRWFEWQSMRRFGRLMKSIKRRWLECWWSNSTVISSWISTKNGGQMISIRKERHPTMNGGTIRTGHWQSCRVLVTCWIRGSFQLWHVQPINNPAVNRYLPSNPYNEHTKHLV